MHVQEIRLQQVLEGTKQYRVPLYQRTYSWTPRQLNRLWSDVAALAESRLADPSATHFTGSLVLSTGEIGPGGSEFLVVDGQQRLTTLSVLIAAIRDHIARFQPSSVATVARLHETYLVDRFKSGDDRLKLLPTQADRAAFRAIVDDAVPDGIQSGVVDAYRFFRGKLAQVDDPDDPNDIDRIASVVLDGLVFVAITANQDDNVYRIFESLNNTGMKLTQGDLLRNYIFMRLGHRGDEVYTSIWLPMQSLLSASELESLFWMEMTWSRPEAKVGDIYALQEGRLSSLADEQIEIEVRRFARLSELLAQIREPSHVREPQIRSALERLAEWGSTATDPLVLKLLSLHADEGISAEDVARALKILESYLVRRLVINAPSNGLSRIVLRAAGELDLSDVVGSLHRYLSTGRKFFASDRQIAEAVTSKPFYFSGRPNQRKTLLSWLELAVAGKEPASLSSASIEHVMPQTLNESWRADLAVDMGEFATVDDVHEAYLHSLANLTLTGYNSELSNSPFATKRELFARSNIALNSYIAGQSAWGVTELNARGADLAALISREWTAPVDDVLVQESTVSWSVAAEIIDSIPVGRWTTYGDVASLAGTHPVPLGGYISRTPIRHAWRVLQAAGTVSPGFRWIPGSEHEGADVRAVLESEGIEFDLDGRAAGTARVNIAELAELAGIEFDDAGSMDFGDEQGDEEVVFTLDGIERRLTREAVRDRLRSATPGKITTYWVEVDGIVWPVKQALAVALGIEATQFQSWTARQRLSTLGFEIGGE
ncbi:DUF262 domain-containing protein [Schumannella sp. 10F1B-5-1]|uniref:GmrSD restriction endonuclease domain-containing protein n=1 Tax=Schumannella sp. 10F1B-5-1 TaxID=2590780 RepID=UPI0021040E12|nr:DUF262 domain-containing protein [Schumannella sp. 10F1B-5-1]